MRKKGDNGVFYASHSGGTLKQRKEREREREREGWVLDQATDGGGGYPD